MELNLKLSAKSNIIIDQNEAIQGSINMGLKIRFEP